MNLKQIKAEPIRSGKTFRDYRVRMEDVIQHKSIKNWIENLQIYDKPENLKQTLLKEQGAYIRVRFFDEEGNIANMEISQDGAGHLCCMGFDDSSHWPELVRIIKSTTRRGRNEKNTQAQDIA